MADGQIGKVAVGGGFLLFVGLVSSTIILAITQIVIARFLGPQEMGIYTIVLLVPNFLIIISDFGISSALTKFLSQYNNTCERYRISPLIKKGILFKIISTSIITCIFILFNRHISQLLKINIYNNLLIISSLYIFGQSLLATINSINLGLDEYIKNTILINLQALLRFCISLILILFGWGVLGPIVGIGMSFTLTACVGLSLIIFLTCSKYDAYDNNLHDFFRLKYYLLYGIPIYLSNLFNSIEGQLRGFLMVYFSSDINIGNYSTAFNFGILLNILATPISSTLFPAFSKINGIENKSSLESIYRLSIKYTSLFLIPISILIYLLSKDIVILLYGSLYEKAPAYLSLFMLSYLSVGIGRLVVVPLLNGQGYSNITLKMHIISLISSLILSLILMNKYDIFGLIISMIISQILSTLYGILQIKKRYDFSPPIRSTFRILISVFFSSVINYYILKILIFKNPFINILINSILFFSQYLFFCPLLGALNQTDLYNLEDLMKGLPFFEHIIKPFLEYERYILKKITGFKS